MEPESATDFAIFTEIYQENGRADIALLGLQFALTQASRIGEAVRALAAPASYSVRLDYSVTADKYPIATAAPTTSD